MKSFTQFLTESKLANTVVVSDRPLEAPRGYPEVIGWFRNQQNPGGWHIVRLDSNDEGILKSEGFTSQQIQSIKRTVSYNGHTSFCKFNLFTGTYAFPDNKSYEDTGILKFQKMVKFSKLLMDDTVLARLAFTEFED